MLLASERLIGTPVMSLQTGGQLAQTKRPIIDPRNLSIVAYELGGAALDHDPSLLRIDDVRELSNIGLIVDSSDEFVAPKDVLKLNDIYNYRFELIGKLVIDENKHKLGKVTNYALEPTTFLIKQLNIKRPILKSFTDTELLIDRSQILEVTDETITIIHDERQPVRVEKATQVFTNPFRGQNPQADAIRKD